MLHPDLNLTTRSEDVLSEFFSHRLEDLPDGGLLLGDRIGSGLFLDVFLINDSSHHYPRQVLKVLQKDPAQALGDGRLAIEIFVQNFEALNRLYHQGAKEMNALGLPIQDDKTYMLRYPFPMKTGTFRGQAATIETNLDMTGAGHFGPTAFAEKMHAFTPHERLTYWQSLFLRLGKADEWGVVNYDLSLGNLGFITSQSGRRDQKKYENTPSFIDFGISFVKGSRFNRRKTSELATDELMKLSVDEREEVLHQSALNIALSSNEGVFGLMKSFESGGDSLIKLPQLELFRDEALHNSREPFKEIHLALYNKDYVRGLE